MTTSLIDSVMNLATPDLTSKIASSLGEPRMLERHGGRIELDAPRGPGKTADPSAMRSVFNLVTTPERARAGHPCGASALEGGVVARRTILSNVFGARGRGDACWLGRVGCASVRSSLMRLAPLLLGVLGSALTAA
jgi:hypothetical protein